MENLITDQKAKKMKNKNVLIYGGIAAIAAAATAYFTLRCTRTMKPIGAHTVSNFNLEKYLGKWYEIARIDFKHERNLSNTSAEYSLNEDGTIAVINRGFNVVTNEWEMAKGKAKFRGAKNIGELKVSFFGPFYAGYNVLALDADYQYALIAGEDTDNLWILSRDTNIPNGIKTEFLGLANSLGFDQSDILWVDHQATKKKTLQVNKKTKIAPKADRE